MELSYATAAGETALWEEHAGRIYRYLLRLSGRQDIAEDLVQETFLLAIRSRRRTSAPLVNESAWLFRIATNLYRDHYRRRRLIAWLPFLPERDGRTVEDVAGALAERDLVAQVLRSLPPDTAAMLLLKDGEGFSTREIAGLMNLDYEAARKRLARARIQFRERYARLEGGESHV